MPYSTGFILYYRLNTDKIDYKLVSISIDGNIPNIIEPNYKGYTKWNSFILMS
jgi:hypothetical protein